jgi:hypothetical protein
VKTLFECKKVRHEAQKVVLNLNAGIFLAQKKAIKCFRIFCLSLRDKRTKRKNKTARFGFGITNQRPLRFNFSI